MTKAQGLSELTKAQGQHFEVRGLFTITSDGTDIRLDSTSAVGVDRLNTCQVLGYHTRIIRRFHQTRLVELPVQELILEIRMQQLTLEIREQ